MRPSLQKITRVAHDVSSSLGLLGHVIVSPPAPFPSRFTPMCPVPAPILHACPTNKYLWLRLIGVACLLPYIFVGNSTMAMLVEISSQWAMHKYFS